MLNSNKLVKTKSTQNRFAFADGLRGLAALWVVFFHLSEGHHVDSLRSVLPNFINDILFNFGHLGVAIFFVLSGYVMAYTVQSSAVDTKLSIKFILRRFLRLTPPYYFAIIFAIAFLLLKRISTQENVTLPSVSDFFIHLLYLQEFFNIHEINTIFWTLCIEVQFYIFFILLVLFSDYINKFSNLTNGRALVFTIVGLLSLPWAFHHELAVFWTGSFIKYWYSFMAGALVCWGIQGSTSQRYFVIIYILAIATAGLITEQQFVFTAGLTASLLLFAGLNNYMNSWLNWKWLQKIGLISYSLYLLHNPITGASANIIHRLLPQGVITDLVVTVAALTTSLITAWIMYKYIEMPSIQLSHKISPVNYK